MSYAEHSADEDEIGGHEPSEYSRAPAPSKHRHHHAKSRASVTKTSEDHHRMGGATSATAAAAVLGAGFALTKLLGRRLMRSRQSNQDEGDQPRDASASSGAMHSPRPLTRRRRAALMNGEAAEEGDAGKAEPSAGPSNKRDTEARTRPKDPFAPQSPRTSSGLAPKVPRKHADGSPGQSQAAADATAAATRSPKRPVTRQRVSAGAARHPVSRSPQSPQPQASSSSPATTGPSSGHADSLGSVSTSNLPVPTDGPPSSPAAMAAASFCVAGTVAGAPLAPAQASASTQTPGTPLAAALPPKLPHPPSPSPRPATPAAKAMTPRSHTPRSRTPRQKSPLSPAPSLEQVMAHVAALSGSPSKPRQPSQPAAQPWAQSAKSDAAAATGASSSDRTAAPVGDSAAPSSAGDGTAHKSSRQAADTEQRDQKVAQKQSEQPQAQPQQQQAVPRQETAEVAAAEPSAAAADSSEGRGEVSTDTAPAAVDPGSQRSIHDAGPSLGDTQHAAAPSADDGASAGGAPSQPVAQSAPAQAEAPSADEISQPAAVEATQAEFDSTSAQQVQHEQQQQQQQPEEPQQQQPCQEEGQQQEEGGGAAAVPQMQFGTVPTEALRGGEGGALSPPAGAALSARTVASKLNPSAKEFCPGSFASSAGAGESGRPASAGAGPVSWADKVKMAAAAADPGPAKPPGNLRARSAPKAAAQKPGRQPQQQQQQSTVGGKRRGGRGDRSTAQPPRSPTAGSASAARSVDTALPELPVRSLAAETQASAPSRDEPALEQPAATAADAAAPTADGGTVSVAPSAGGLTKPRSWASIAAPAETSKPAADPRNAELAAPASPPSAAANVGPGAAGAATPSDAPSDAAEAAPESKVSEDDGWTQVASRAKGSKRTPSPASSQDGRAMPPPTAPRNAASGGRWGRQQPPSASGWQDAPRVQSPRGARDGSAQQPLLGIASGAQAAGRGGERAVRRSSSVGDVHSNNHIASAVAAPIHAGPRLPPASSAPRRRSGGRGASVTSSGSLGGGEAVAAAAAAMSDSQPAASDRAPPPSDGATEAPAAAGEPEEVAQEQATEAAAATEPTAEIQSDPTAEAEPARDDDIDQGPPVEDEPAAAEAPDSSESASPPAEGSRAAQQTPEADSTSEADPPSATAPVEPTAEPSAQGEAAIEARESSVRGSSDLGNEAEEDASHGREDSPAGDEPSEDAGKGSTAGEETEEGFSAGEQADKSATVGGSPAVVVPAGAVGDLPEDPDMPGTPDQSKNSSHQVAESLSAVGEEDYSTPAASDAGGSEHLTTSSRSATAAGFDPLGMGPPPSAEEQAKAIWQAKQLIEAGLIAYTRNGNVDGAEKMVATAVRVLRDAAVSGEPLAEAEAALGDIYHGTGRTEDALDHLSLAHQVAEDADAAGAPVRPPLAVKLANNLITVQRGAGQTQKAAVLACRFSEAMAARFGPASRWTTHSRIQAACCREEAGQKEEAVAGLQSETGELLALAQRLEGAGPHPPAAPPAAADEDGGDPNGVGDGLPADLGGEEEERDPVVGARHAAARLLVTLGEHLVRLGRSDQAEKAFREADEAAEAAWGAGAPHTFYCRAQLAAFLRSQPGKTAKGEAVELHEALLAMTEAHRGPDEQTAEAHYTMARVYMEAGRPVDAVIAANRAVDITSSLVPHRRHQALEKPYLLLATAREAAGDYSGAKEAQRVAGSIRKYMITQSAAAASQHHRGGPMLMRPQRRK